MRPLSRTSIPFSKTFHFEHRLCCRAGLSPAAQLSLFSPLSRTCLDSSLLVFKNPSLGLMENKQRYPRRRQSKLIFPLSVCVFSLSLARLPDDNPRPCAVLRCTSLASLSLSLFVLSQHTIYSVFNHVSTLSRRKWCYLPNFSVHNSSCWRLCDVSSYHRTPTYSSKYCILHQMQISNKQTILLSINNPMGIKRDRGDCSVSCQVVEFERLRALTVRVSTLCRSHGLSLL
jgi:hypothetical protein